MFAAYMAGEGRQIAWGGRYDNIGKAFGRQRDATGFSTDLKNLISVRRDLPASREKIFAPSGGEGDLLDKINELRLQGRVVIQELEGQCGGARELGCDATLIRRNDSWVIEELDELRGR
jgi:ATP phosphoribosyltransferase regulatory subunit